MIFNPLTLFTNRKPPMDNVLQFYIDSGYTLELRDQIYKSFELLQEFDYPDLFQAYHDILGNDQLADNSSLRDRFVLQIEKDLRYVASLHSVEFADSINLLTLNNLVEFFLTIQHLVDYDMILSTMESSELTNEEVLVAIMNEYTGIEESQLMEYITEFNPKFLEYLKIYALSKSNLEIPPESKETIDRKASIIKGIKLYAEHIDPQAVGVELVKLGVLLDQPFGTYYGLVKDDLSAKISKDLASDIISLSIISQNKESSPLDNFRSIASDLGVALSDAIAIERTISSIYSTFTGLVSAS